MRSSCGAAPRPGLRSTSGASTPNRSGCRGARGPGRVTGRRVGAATPGAEGPGGAAPTPARHPGPGREDEDGTGAGPGQVPGERFLLILGV